MEQDLFLRNCFKFKIMNQNYFEKNTLFATKSARMYKSGKQE